jgi:hypothetical protein
VDSPRTLEVLENRFAWLFLLTGTPCIPPPCPLHHFNLALCPFLPRCLSSPTGTVVGTLSASDPEKDALVFTLAAPLGSCPLTLLPNGTLVVNATLGALDHEATPSCALTVQTCEDITPDRLCGNATIAASVVIADVNEAPAFLGASLALTVPERAPVGTVLGTLAFTDPDLGDTATMSLVASSTGDASVPFVVLTNGSVVLLGALDAEVRSGYLFTARVTDAKGLLGVGIVNVTVVDVSDAPVLACGVDASAPGVTTSVVEHALGAITPLAVVVTEQDGARPVSVLTVSASSPSASSGLVPVLLSRPSADLPPHVQRCVWSSADCLCV